jgi:hypothetical protein
LRYEPRLVRGSGIGHGSRDRSGGYGFPPELDVCDPIDENMAEIIKTNQKRVVRELELRDILAVAGGVVIGIIIWVVVLKGGAD